LKSRNKKTEKFGTAASVPPLRGNELSQYSIIFSFYKSIFFFVILVNHIAPPWRAAFYISQKISIFIAHNVSAVYDGLTARIEKCAAFLGLANCGCSEPWEWSVAE
jgi:hypothetical protein